MKARDILSQSAAKRALQPTRNVSAETGVLELLPLLLDTSDHLLGVTEGDRILGVVDESSLLEGLNRLIQPRDDSSTVVLSTSPTAFSASHIAHAVEDADVNLVDFWTAPSSDGQLTVTLRVTTTDPSAVAGSLERYGYEVLEASGNTNRDLDVALERILSLKAMLEV